jgi:hypothetical protein
MGVAAMTRTCPVCGGSLEDRRPQARTCSAACRREAASLEALLADLTEFCRARKAAYFLIDNQDTGLASKIDQLQDLRFAHMLSESETVPDEGSRRHKVLLLDVSHLSAQRALEVDFEGWQDRSKRRRRQLVYHEGAGAQPLPPNTARDDSRSVPPNMELFPPES